MHEFTSFRESLLIILSSSVFASCEPSQSFLINVHSQWVKACYRDVYSKIKFEAVKCQGIVDVFTTNILLSFFLWDLLDLVCHNNTPTLTTGGWLTNPEFGWVIFKVIFEVHELIGQDVGAWDEAKMLCSVNLSHPTNRSIHQVFTRHIETVGKMIHTLVPCKRLVYMPFDWPCLPIDGPTTIVVLMVRLYQLEVLKSVVLQCEPYNLDIIIVQVEIITSVCGWVGSNGHWVIVGTED